MLYAVMPVKDEADRWLSSTLSHLAKRRIGVLVCDDGSTDDTVAIAQQFENVTVVSRPVGIPSFLEHEGYFRQWCWSELPALGIAEDDWVLAIDADEFFLGEPKLDAPKAITAWAIPVVEIWAVDDEGAIYERKDGFWPHNDQPRLARWQDRTPVFRDRKMASGSIPLYAQNGVLRTNWERILHFGYARSIDRQRKYERYTLHNFGHNPIHIESILTSPSLERWAGEVPCLQAA